MGTLLKSINFGGLTPMGICQRRVCICPQDTVADTRLYIHIVPARKSGLQEVAKTVAVAGQYS